jgi:hypothetical protein
LNAVHLVLRSFCNVVSSKTNDSIGINRHTLVDIGLGVVGELVLLVDSGILSGAGPGGDVGIVVLSDILVCLLGSLSASTLDGLSDVVGGVLYNG